MDVSWDARVRLVVAAEHATPRLTQDVHLQAAIVSVKPRRHASATMAHLARAFHCSERFQGKQGFSRLRGKAVG
jgi:hypothetical protein